MRIIQTLVATIAGTTIPAWCYDAQQPIVVPQISQPLIGFGTWNLNLSPENTTKAVSFAIQSGYRQIDCAAAYSNEKAVGEGIADGLKKAHLTRADLWVTSKLWNDHHEDLALVEAGLNQTLSDLGLDYIDLYLMHWPVGTGSETKKTHFDYVETWRAMIALPKSKVTNIGISNFAPSQLQKIISKTGIKPFAHQMELHPYLQQSSWVATHKALGISLTAYSPLGNTNPTYGHDKKDAPPPLLKNDALVDIARARNCTTAQVSLAWGMGRGISVIPKSSHPDHILGNLHADDCVLTYLDLKRLRLEGRKYLTRFNNPSDKWGVSLFEGLDGV